MSSEIFWNLGCTITKHNMLLSEAIGMRLFREFFGTTPIPCELIWRLFVIHHPTGFKPIHLLWTCFFVKQYQTEGILQAINGVTPKTYRKWVEKFLYAAQHINMVIYFSNYIKH